MILLKLASKTWNLGVWLLEGGALGGISLVGDIKKISLTLLAVFSKLSNQAFRSREGLALVPRITMIKALVIWGSSNRTFCLGVQHPSDYLPSPLQNMRLIFVIWVIMEGEGSGGVNLQGWLLRSAVATQGPPH